MRSNVEKTPIHQPGRRPGAVLRVDLRDRGTGRVARSSFRQEHRYKLVAVINGPGSTQDKRRMLTQIIDSAVDVDGVAQFCLGRFWRQASPQQQQRFVMLFHQVLVSNIMAKLGEIRASSSPSVAATDRARTRSSRRWWSGRTTRQPTSTGRSAIRTATRRSSMSLPEAPRSAHPAQRLCVLPGAQKRRCADQRPAAAGGAEQLVPLIPQASPPNWVAGASRREGRQGGGGVSRARCDTRNTLSGTHRNCA